MMKPKNATRLTICPMTLTSAKAFILQYHRHHLPPPGGLFAVGVVSEEEIIGVAIIGRPVARLCQNGWTAEVTRIATTGHPNACSALYAAAWRAAKALGYKRLITYTLKSESGSSLRGAGFRLIGECGGGTWNRRKRPRIDKHPLQTKLRWEKTVP